MHRILATVPLLAASALALPLSAETSYDYIIVGGGTSGLVVANRLSELDGVTVAVIEAGGSVYNNPNVTDPDGYGLAFGTSIDYAYETTNQTYTGGSVQTMRAAKALGGTSTINGMAYTRAQDVQIDAWEALGNEGWNWKELYPYYLKSEQIELPTTAQTESGVKLDPVYHGTTGPLKVGWKSGLMNSSFPNVLNETYATVGVEYLADIAGGNMVGWTMQPSTLDTELNVRHDAARAYYYPHENRTNYHIFLNTTAQKLVWSELSDCDATASGVLVSDSAGNTRTIYANKEVILSAGALKSSVLLELSGVGNPSILEQAGIEVKVDLPGVGENLQDQTNNGIDGTATKSFTGTPGYVAYPNVDAVFGNQTTAVALSVKNALRNYAELTSNYSNGVISADVLESAFQIQYDLIFTDKIPIAEVLIYPTDSAFSSEFWGLLPFARGNIHVTSSDPSVAAKINPNYYMLDWDLTQQVGVAKFIRNMFDTAPLSELLAEETEPGLTVVPKNGTDDAWGTWIKSTYRSNFHPVSTTAMTPKEQGGVVDSSLKVYGTSNVRVVDAGILPFQVCGHLVSTLYAVAEKASDIIKASA